MITKNEVYLIRQPKFTTLALVYFPDTFEIDTDTAHSNLFKLTEQTDSIFVFEGESEEIELDKFASLYGACGWLVQDGSPSTGLVKLLSYSKEIFQTHSSFVLCRQEELEKTGMKEAIQSISAAILSEITQPVLRIRRLSKEELKEIYTAPHELRRGWKFWEKEEPRSNNRFATWTVSSILPFFKMSTVNLLLGSDKEWRETFDFSDVRYFLGSFLKHEAVKYLNKDLPEICQAGSKKEGMENTRQE